MRVAQVQHNVMFTPPTKCDNNNIDINIFTLYHGHAIILLCPPLHALTVLVMVVSYVDL